MTNKKPKKLTQAEWKEVEDAIYEYSPQFSMRKELKAKTTYAYKLSTLQSSLRNGKVNESYGLCFHTKSDQMSYYLSPYWPKWSGSRNHPIIDKTNKEFKHPNEQYRFMHKWVGNQLKLRSEYTKFLLANLSGYCAAVERALEKAGKDPYGR